MKARKLQLRKVTVANLDKFELNKVLGGTDETNTTVRSTHHYENSCVEFFCNKEVTYTCIPTR